MSEQPPLTGPATPGTAAGAIEFLDAAADKGWLNSGTARALRTATVKILSIDEAWEQQDLQGLDLDEHFDRFQTLKHNEYSDGSMRVYKSRFQQAVRMYLARVAKDPNWKSYGPGPRNGGAGKNGKHPAKKSAASEATTVRPTLADSPPPTIPPAVTASPAARQIDHLFPLRDELDVTLRLPRDLTSAEADELADYIRTLARKVVPGPKEAS